MEAFALPIFRMGHIPVLGEWFALPLVHLAGSKKIGDEQFNEIFIQLQRDFLEKCDAVLIDKANRSRTIEAWQNGSSEINRKGTKACWKHIKSPRMQPPAHATKQCDYMEKATQRRKSSGSLAVVERVWWNGVEHIEPILGKDWLITELVATVPNWANCSRRIATGLASIHLPKNCFRQALALAMPSLDSGKIWQVSRKQYDIEYKSRHSYISLLALWL